MHVRKTIHSTGSLAFYRKEKTMRVILRIVPVGLALCALAAGPASKATSLISSPRVFNDVPEAVLNMSASGSSAFVSESGMNRPGANRDDFLVSSDGVTPTTLNNTDAFSFFTDVTLTADPISPRKEAGIRLNSSIGGDFLFIINSDAHEIVSFGGPGPFFNFRDGNNFGGPGTGASNYNVGDTVTMGFTYLNQGGSFGSILTLIQNGITYNSPFQAWTNTEQGVIDGSNLALYFQMNGGSTAGPNNGSATFSNIRYGTSPSTLAPLNTAAAIPEPGSMALLATGLLPLVGLRRKRK
jgi:hypothetical protein